MTDDFKKRIEEAGIKHFGEDRWLNSGEFSEFRENWTAGAQAMLPEIEKRDAQIAELSRLLEELGDFAKGLIDIVSVGCDKCLKKLTDKELKKLSKRLKDSESKK